ncbi:MAG: PQQ-binding-like beta-propeller repeat protein, partial [Chitinophagaceae bacterium]|nr:PQQ-binding-like beta-propeller repeat protein [Chitinophagaceae bacterium]
MSCTSHSNDYSDWPVTRGSKESINYSGLSQIDTLNVKGLQPVWIYHSENNNEENYGVMECNPIVIDGVLYGVSPKMKLFALKADTGEEIWKFDPADSIVNPRWHLRNINMNRGVTYWADGEAKRIIYTVGPIVFQVDAEDGKLIREFGTEGGIDLRFGLDRNPDELFVAPTSPVMIYKDLFFVSGLVSGNTPGHIRGFDIRTGAQKWIFHTVPYPGEYGYETWEDTTAYLKMGSTNSWAGFSLDEQRGILYATTGNPTNDFYGGRRLGDGLFGNCIIALNAQTGERIWHYQTVRHDVWDMDVSSAPGLATITREGKKIDVVIQTTKTGLIFVLDRDTGEPVFPVEEKSVATDDAATGEKLSATQPVPLLPKPFSRQVLTGNDLNDLVDSTSRQDIKNRFSSLRYEGMFTPPTEKGTLIFPGYDGGGEWGGGAFDPQSEMFYVNANEMAWVLNLVKEKENTKTKKTNLEAGRVLYHTHCMSCHGPERQGGGDYPGLIGVENKYSLAEFMDLVTSGR